jgi:hypothetical protein
MSRRFLYRKLGSAVIVILALFAAVAPRSAAQERPQLKRPQETPDEKPPETKKTKKGKGPRAVGLLELNSSGKATLIPIAILIDGKFYDASVYKADPVPMALESGTVYEAEPAGESKGLFTINGARHNKNSGSPSPWVGTGAYLPQGTEAPKTTRKAEDVPVGMDNSSDEPPRLTRGNASKPAAAPNPSSAPASSTPAGTGSSEKPGTTAAPASTQPASGSSSSTSSGQDTQKPAAPPVSSDKPADQGAKEQAPATPPGQASPGQASAGQASQSQAPQSQASQNQASENYYRPTLRRGKPTQPAPEADELLPRSGKAESSGTATSAASTGPVQLVPAISDAGGPDPRSYKFFWKEGEEEERRKQMLALAADEVRAYVSARAKGAITAKPAAKAGVPARKSTVKPPQPVLENIQFRAFDVWGNNQPVMILSVEAHLPAAPVAASAPETYSITLVARTDIYGNLRKLYSGVTDKFHLDVTSRLELIDAVDADGDGRGELLFRETTDAGSGYVIYRATADKLWKMFDSLGAE